ncbi:(Fe-S)-binding protein [Gimesia fumaroli]|uniref:Glycolate oxidase iron-sulfur subunit n=1 Tax=Gimesia fumaroli TaxID=2527976 RepID=A0A518IBC3_9PLAN|nr:heterodisulfide reductase-related iron-sulfur binding cluster [Gimesia fumaroli]QDV50401.1 Lactate utilization protein A [Gimesia fumaroli]
MKPGSSPSNSAVFSKDPEQVPGSQIPYENFLDCIHCGLCTAACPTYLETGNENDSPRGRIYLMRAIVDQRIELSDAVRGHLDLCLDCRSCETACPSGVQYGRLIEPFRVDVHKMESEDSAGPQNDWFHRWILYRLFPYPNRIRWTLLPARVMQFLRIDKVVNALRLPYLLPAKLRRMNDLLPRLQPAEPALPEILPAKGTQRARVALFTGCVSEAMYSHVNHATARVLQANGCEVIVPRTQGCCGAIHYHSGADEEAIKFALQNLAAFDLENIDAIIVNVAGCGAMLKDYGHIAEETKGVPAEQVEKLKQLATKFRDVSEFLFELGPIAPEGEIPIQATYHDACHLVHAQKVQNQPRKLLELVPGLELIPLNESTICCGAAGSYNLTQPEMADQLGQRKLKNILDTGANVVISGNVGCTLQIDSKLRQAHKPLWVAHPMEILDLSYRNQKPTL